MPAGLNLTDLAWLAAPLAALVSGFLLLGRGARAVGRGRMASGGRNLAGGVAAIVAALLAALVALNMQSYARLTWEAPVAEVQVRQSDATQKLYDVTVVRLDKAGGEVKCLVQGDEWILGGRVQTWKPWARTLGMNASYELDQLANKYVDALEANGKPITACDLRRSPNGMIARLPADVKGWLSEVSLAEDRRFGSASYMPLADGATYRVIITQTGFNAEPANDAAKGAVRNAGF
jgi:hypothetical protein